MPDSPPENNRKEENLWRQIGRYSNLAFVLPAAIILGLVIGHLLDRWLKTSWIHLAGLFGRLYRRLCRADSRNHPVEQRFMTTPFEESTSDQEPDPEILNLKPVDPAMEARLSGAYGRISAGGDLRSALPERCSPR